MKAREIKFEGHTVKFFLRLISSSSDIWIEISQDKAGFIIRNRNAKPEIIGANIFWNIDN